MEAIVLSFRGEPIRVFPLQGRPLEVGSGPGCDVVVHDAEVPARAWLVQEASDGVPVARPLAEGGPVRRLLPGVELAVGTRHSLSRAPELAPRGTRELSLVTEPIYVGLEPHEHLTLVLGRGRDARRFRLEGRPLTIGSQADCDVVILDRAVSGIHCRLEPGRQTAWVRDLGSRNGTWIDNVRTELGRVAAGSRIRLGRTEIYVVEEGRPGDAREEGLVAASWQMIEILGKVERLAKTMSPVLVRGESGTGKEVISRAVHVNSPRREGPFVKVDCAALPEQLIENELFGHERGAFTGADRTTDGKVEQAHGGTLFLDEVGELPLTVQGKLLRLLQEKTFLRVGGAKARQVDVRFVCATHRDLRCAGRPLSARSAPSRRAARLGLGGGPRDRCRAHHAARSADEVGARARRSLAARSPERGVTSRVDGGTIASCASTTSSSSSPRSVSPPPPSRGRARATRAARRRAPSHRCS
jgi:pSer/pThr/pTyr-binding forkhead associated (FHA) protein